MFTWYDFGFDTSISIEIRTNPKAAQSRLQRSMNYVTKTKMEKKLSEIFVEKSKISNFGNSMC